MASSRPSATRAAPPSRPTRSAPPHLDFAPLQNSVDALNQAAQRYADAVTALGAEGGKALAKHEVGAIDDTIMHSEQLLTMPDGLPSRPWYRHLIYAPGFYT